MRHSLIRACLSNATRMIDNVMPLSTSTFSDCLNVARDLLVDGGVVALPTDTIYGIASLIPHVDKLYKVKGREFSKAIALSVEQPLDIRKYAVCTISDDLLNKLLPGPVTLIFNRKPTLPQSLNPDHTTVAIRVPDDRFVQDLTRILGEPLALTSANRSNEPSALDPIEFQSIWPSLNLVIDAGRLPSTNLSRFGSTIVDLTVPGEFLISRDGCALEASRRILKDHGLKERIC